MSEITVLEITYCSNCKENYARTPRMSRAACGVYHPPESCCHIGWRKIGERESRTLGDLLSLVEPPQIGELFREKKT